MPNASAQKRKPQTRRWRRWGRARRLLAGGVVLLSLAGLAAALFYATAVWPDRRSVPYRQAMAQLRGNASAVRLLGRPVETGWWVRGDVRADSARLAIPVKGGARAGVLHVEAQRAAAAAPAGNAWRFSRLELSVADNNVRLSLLEEKPRREESSQRDSSNALPLGVPPRYQE